MAIKMMISKRTALPLAVLVAFLVSAGAVIGPYSGNASAGAPDAGVAVVNDYACDPYKRQSGSVTISNLRVYRVSCSKATAVAANWIRNKRSSSGWKCKTSNSVGSGGGNCRSSTGNGAYLYWFASSRR